MKKLIILITVMLTSFLVGQNWTSVISTNINVNGASSVDIFTNGAGNHIIVQESNALKYYKMGVNGTAGTPVTLESSSVVSPSISGDATRLYVVYRKTNESYVKTKYSSNGGTSWSYLATNPQNSNTSSVECVFSNNRLHLTFQVSNVIYYAKYEGSSWSTPVIVSTNENGTGPRITAWYNESNDKIYFYYKKLNTHIGKWREYNFANGVWGTLWEGYSLNNVQQSGPVGFRVDDNRIYLYYWYYGPDPFGDYHYYFNWRVINKSNNNLFNYGTPDMQPSSKIYATYTANGLAHSVFYYTWLAGESQYEVGIWRSNINNGYPSDLVYEYTSLQYYPNHLNLSSASNDVYVIWQDGIGGNNLRFIYDDQAPLAPTGLTISEDANNHPRLDWNVSPEPDKYIYKIYRYDTYGGGWQYLNQTTNTTFTDQTLTYCHAVPPAQCPDLRNFSFRVTVVDNGSQESSPSNEVTARLVGGPPPKIVANPNSNEPIDYSLSQNYPNPFNPTTTISYSIKLAGEVTLKVYDMLGIEVANLVNERQEAGTYSVEFNAPDLPSGMYVYRITSGNFVNTKKLILLK